MDPFQHMLCEVIRADGQAHSARTVEIFGWIMFAEAAGLLFAPHFAAALLHLPPLSDQAANYLRLVGLLVGGGHALHRQRPPQRARFRFRHLAGSAPGAAHHGAAVVVRSHSRTAGDSIRAVRRTEFAVDVQRMAPGKRWWCSDITSATELWFQQA